MRRIVALCGGVALVTASLAAPVAAARSQRISDTESVLYCDSLQADEGVVFLIAVESEAFGSFADLAFWQAPATPDRNPPAWIAITGSADFTDNSISASFELVDYDPTAPSEEGPFGDPVGTATLQANLTPEGDPHPYHTRDHSGNQNSRSDGVVQEFSVTGTLELPTGITFDLSQCEAYRNSYTRFSNSPASSVFRYSEFSLNCFWEVDDTFIGLFAFGGSFGSYSEVFVYGPDSELIGVPNADLTLTTSAISASYDVFDGLDPSAVDPVGSAAASATLTPGGRINEIFRSGSSKTHIAGTSYEVDGSLSIMTPDATYELPMDSESCFAADVRVTEHFSARQGPRGKPLANDAPSGALPIAVGQSVSVRTVGTRPDPEAPCLVNHDGDSFEVPITKTAWWTFEGTGGEVTVDTAGSDFDTIVGIYTNDGGGFVQVGCVDDVDSLQARITVPTDAGMTYFIQAGGFASSYGTLLLSLN